MIDVMSSDPIRSPQRLAAVARTRLLDSPPEAEFDRLTELARALLSAPFAFVTVVDDRRSYWKSCLGVNLPPGVPPQNTVEESFCQYVVSSGEPLVLADVREVPLTRANPSIESMGVVAWAGFPVRTPDGEVLGTFCVVDTQVHEWSDTDVAMLAHLAAVASDQVALRIALADAERQRQRAELLDRSATLLTAGLEIDDVLDAVGKLAVDALGDHAAVHTVQPGGVLRLAAARSRNGSPRPARRAPVRIGTGDAQGPGRVAATGHSELVTDVPATLAPLDEPVRRAAEALGAVSSVSVPLRPPGADVLGVLTVVRTAGSPPHDAGDVELAEVIAGRAALVLDNARRFGQERDFSLRLQEALLTPPPQPEHLAMAVRYSPAERRTAVGGDWYDAFLLPGGATALVIGDVTGHDRTAAVAMGQLRGLIRAIAYDTDAAPAEVLERSDIAAAGLVMETTATALVARIDRPDPGSGGRVLRWSNAGHPAPALLDTDGQVRLLDTKPNRMLGVEPAVRRDEHTALLREGQTLLLFTDGLIERRGADYDQGIAALLQALAGLHELPLEDLADTLLRRLQPAVAEDDVALIAVRAMPEPT
ncbi:Serine phosphatase RsbU, regulator of sigma subunit [Blastococcus sp. DSM 46786]|nr:Serine phosphatase RsbU, regulator of sigma subunit [Blastococcus sp. DSM 46786]